jgi:SAM-dependent methyltransferase
MRSLLYHFPSLYELALKIIHRENIKKRYEYIASKIKKNEIILDLGCGTGILGRFIGKCKYIGFELNGKFVKYAKKKGFNVIRKNIFDFSSYPKKIDTIVLCDVLHHIYPRHKFLLKKIRKFAKKIIICEPYDNEKETLMKKLMRTIEIIIDFDGYNSIIKKIHKRWYSKRGLISFFKNSIKDRRNLSIKEIGKDLIAIYKL